MYQRIKEIFNSNGIQFKEDLRKNFHVFRVHCNYFFYRLNTDKLYPGYEDSILHWGGDDMVSVIDVLEEVPETIIYLKYEQFEEYRKSDNLQEMVDEIFADSDVESNVDSDVESDTNSDMELLNVSYDSQSSDDTHSYETEYDEIEVCDINGQCHTIRNHVPLKIPGFKSAENFVHGVSE